MDQKIYFMEEKVLMGLEDMIQKNQDMIAITEMDREQKALYFQTITLDLRKQKMTEVCFRILKNSNKN